MQQMPLTLFPFEPFLIVSVVGSWDWLLVSYGGVLEEGKITHKENKLKLSPLLLEVYIDDFFLFDVMLQITSYTSETKCWHLPFFANERGFSI